jgi:Family of unknown function (DUF6252)
MNKLKFISAFVLLFLVVFFSCTTEPYGGVIPEPLDPNAVNPTVANSVGVFKADFDGQTFTANTTQAIVNSQYVAISGVKSTGEFFQITIPSATVGTYNLATSPTNFGLIYSQGSGLVPYLATSSVSGPFSGFPNYTDTSEVKITSIDAVNKKISGTFKFTGARFAGASATTIETKVFTNGSFTNLSYTNDVVVAPTTNTFTVKKDGVDFISTNISGFKSGGSIAIIGRRGSVENVGVFIPDNASVGATYTITPLGNERCQYVMDATPTGILGGTGSVTVISHDITNKRIKGTFNFVAATLLPPSLSFNFTLGTFDVTYL